MFSLLLYVSAFKFSQPCLSSHPCQNHLKYLLKNALFQTQWFAYSVPQMRIEILMPTQTQGSYPLADLLSTNLLIWLSITKWYWCMLPQFPDVNLYTWVCCSLKPVGGCVLPQWLSKALTHFIGLFSILWIQRFIFLLPELTFPLLSFPVFVCLEGVFLHSSDLPTTWDPLASVSRELGTELCVTSFCRFRILTKPGTIVIYDKWQV